MQPERVRGLLMTEQGDGSTISRMRMLGRLPSDDEAQQDPEILERWSALLARLNTPVSDEQSMALCGMFPSDESDSYGLAWGLLHAIETSPGWPVEAAMEHAPRHWQKIMRDRLTAAGDEYRVPARSVAMVGALAHEFPALTDLLKEHLSDNFGEILPTLFLSDAVRWMTEHTDQRDTSVAILAWLERAFDAGDDDVKDAIGTGFVEMVPDPGQPGSWMRQEMGPALRSADPWSR